MTTYELAEITAALAKHGLAGQRRIVHDAGRHRDRNGK